MSDLTTAEKEQVAELLGYVKCKHDDDATHWNGIGEEWPACIPERDVFTLEACMEYAKGKGWDYQLSGGSTWDSEATVYTTNQSRQYATPFYGLDESDPLAAMVRALLKAEEASREG